MRTAYSQVQINKTKSVARTIGDSNNILILYELFMFGEKSFNELKRMTGINAVTLSKKLKSLKSEGLVQSRNHGIVVIYSCTKESESLRPLLENIQKLVLGQIA